MQQIVLSLGLILTHCRGRQFWSLLKKKKKNFKFAGAQKCDRSLRAMKKDRLMYFNKAEQFQKQVFVCTVGTQCNYFKRLKHIV